MSAEENTSASSDSDEELRGNIRTVVYIYLLATIIVIGIILNILNIIILMQKPMKSNVYLYLRAMSFSDMLALIFDITYAANLYARRPKWTWPEAMYGAHVEFFLKQSCNATGVILIMLTAIERYISLCHPHKAPVLCTRKRTLILIFCAVALAVLFNIPRIWERSITTIIDPATNRTKYLDKGLSEFSKGDYYTFHKYLYASLFQFFPLLLLAILNTRIIFALRQYNKKKDQISTQSYQQKKEQKRTTMVLIMVVIAFLILITPSAIAYILQDDNSFAVFIFVCIADLMGETNFAINFFIYIIFNKTFRTVFVAFFTCKKFRGRNMIGVSVLPTSRTPRPDYVRSHVKLLSVKSNQIQPHNNNNIESGDEDKYTEAGPSTLHI